MKKNTEIPSDAINYFDTEAFELVSIMEIIENPQDEKDEAVASVLETSPIILEDPIENLIETHGTLIRAVKYKRTIGFNHTTGERFHKFVTNIYKRPQIRARVSHSFIRNLTFRWLVDTKEKGQAPSNFSSHLLSSVSDATVEHKIFFHIVCLLLNKPFSIGNVQFGFFKREYFNEFIEARKHNYSEEDLKSYSELWAKYPGRCYSMVHVKAETERAKEIAFLHCGRAIDVLKICSPTLLVPQLECMFEIDKRLTRNTETEILIETITHSRDISVTVQGAGRPYSLTDSEMLKFKERGLDVFDKFLQDIEVTTTELQKMILIAIQRLAASFVLKDFHQRLAEICSILESLLLLNESGSMTEIVCRYFCRLVHSAPDNRKELDKLYKKLYAVRSAWVHHAKRNSLEMAELAYLQQCAQRLLQVLITKTEKHEKKETILAEIDDALFRS